MLSENESKKQVMRVWLVLILVVIFGLALSLALWMILGDTFPLYVFLIPFIASVIAAGAIHAGQRKAKKINRGK